MIRRTPVALVSLLCLAAFAPLAGAKGYPVADAHQRPNGDSTRILPEKFLRGYDPITVYFDDAEGPSEGPADDGARWLKISPTWPGAWSWVDRRTLQFRPAERWPALARYQVSAKGARKILTTMMAAPSSMSPESGSTDLRPFHQFTLSFPQTLPLDQLRRMLHLEIRTLPGLDGAPVQALKDFRVALLPRSDRSAPAVYAVTLARDVPENSQLRVEVSLALGEAGTVLWTGRLSTRPHFRIEAVSCGDASRTFAAGTSLPSDLALACGNQGHAPQILFSSEVQTDLDLSALKRLVRLQPSVPDLHFQTYGKRIQLQGHFRPDTLYRMTLSTAPIHDVNGRSLVSPKGAELFFYLGWRAPFLRWNRSAAILEANGPRMLPLVGYGDPKADVRVYRIDPLQTGLWPFSSSPVTVNESAAPPFPGEEPTLPELGSVPSTEEVTKQIRLLGSPLVSKVVKLPLSKSHGTTRFGLPLGPLLDSAVGNRRPGTYLVGLRRLKGPPTRTYVRVQVTNLSLTSVEERDRVVFYVRTLDENRPVEGARIVLEGTRRSGKKMVPAKVERTTDSNGRAELPPQPGWRSVNRISVRRGEDVLVIDPRNPPPRFADDHWSVTSRWLGWIGAHTPAPKNDRRLGFLFTDRPIYRPGDKVYLKGYLRKKVGGTLRAPGSSSDYVLRIYGPDGQTTPLPLHFTANGGFDATLKQKNPPTGEYTAAVLLKKGLSTIAERTFQIEAYRIPKLEVHITGPDTVPLDRPFGMKALARYYAGGSAVARPIRWRVTRSPYHYVPKGREGFLFADSSHFERKGARRPPGVMSGQGLLDSTGANVFTVNPAADIDGSARIYHFEATVTGADNQPVSAVRNVKALPPFILGMKLPRFSHGALTLRPKVIAVGPDGKLVEGKKIRVRLYRREWHSHLRETNFAVGEPRYVTRRDDVKLAERTIHSATKPVEPRFVIREPGVYVVELFSRDRLGRVQSLSADLYVGGKGQVAWMKPKAGVFELTPDKTSYRPGTTAKLVIQSPFQKAAALVIVEEPSGNTYRWLRVRGGKAVAEIPIASRNVPNLPVHVVVMRGRLPDSDAHKDDSRYRPKTVASSIDLKVEPVKNELKVHVDHPKVALPGARVKLTVSLADDLGHPMAGEVTLWLVDEAVLSLAKEGPLDPLTAMVVRNAPGSSVRDTRNEVIGRIAEQEQTPGGDGLEDASAQPPGLGTHVVRRNFATVPYYRATLEIPASGLRTVTVKLSDDLTNFAVRAVASSGWTRFGFEQTRLRVRLPVIVQPALPRFVRRGDSFFAGAVGRIVEGNGGPVKFQLSVAGPVSGKPLASGAKLAASVAHRFGTRFTVEQGNGKENAPAQLTVSGGMSRVSDGAGDAFEVKLPVLPDRRPETFAYFATLKPGQVKLKGLPEPPRKGSVRQTLLFSSTPGLMQIASGLDYLARYPHGCLEQKLSRLYPEVALGGLLDRLGLSDAYVSRVGLNIDRLVSEMALYQDEAGLFSYWPGGPGDLQLTAQAVAFLHQAGHAGYKVDGKVQTAAVTALQRALRSDAQNLDSTYRYDQQTLALEALAEAGHLDTHYLLDLFHLRARMDLASLANLTVAMAEAPDVYHPNLATLGSDLWDGVVIQLHHGKKVYKGLSWRRRFWEGGYLGSSTATLASVLEGLLRVDPTDARLPILRDALLARASADNGFGSTFENRRALHALSLYLEEAKVPSDSSTVRLDGKTLALKSGRGVRVVREGEVPAEVGVSGHAVGARIAYHYLPRAPGDREPALSRGFIVSRSGTVIHKDGSPETHYADAKGMRLKLAKGDVVELHTRITTDKQRYHVALVVPFAAGLEPLNPKLKNVGAIAKPSQEDSLEPTYVQRLDSEVRYYFAELPAGTYSFHFRVRAATEGSFVQPGPWAEQMYHEAVHGRGVGMRVDIE